MGLFSTSNITCNERPSVGRNFRDTINESASPINRFTEKVETRSFDEIFYEADIAIREASNSMNKLWYKSVLESDTVESAIINEANVFSKVIEVIKTIFDAIKRAVASMLRKARAFLQKIFKKKPKDASDNKDSKDNSKDSKSDNRNTDKESTPTDKVEEIESKKADLEREIEELQSKLKEVKKNEEKKKKEEPKTEPAKSSGTNKEDDSIDTSNIDTSKLDSANKKKQTVEMDGLSISGEELKKKIKETEDKLKKVEDELKTAEKETSVNPKSKTSSSSTSQDKSDSKTSSGNDDAESIYNKYISDIEGNWDSIVKCFSFYRRDVKNGPKITPYIDLFNFDKNDNTKVDMCNIFENSFANLRFFVTENSSVDSALHIVLTVLSQKSDSDIKDELSFRVKNNKFQLNQYKQLLNAETTISDKAKNLIVAGFVTNLRLGAGLKVSYVPNDKFNYTVPASTNLDNALKGGDIKDDSGVAETPVDVSVSDLDPSKLFRFLDNIRDMKKNNTGGILKSIEDGLKSIDDAKNMFTKKANMIMVEINKLTKSLSNLKDVYQYYSSEFIPVIQKTMCESISSVASVINQVYSTRIKIFTEAFSKGNTWFEACLKLCIAAELASKKK